MEYKITKVGYFSEKTYGAKNNHRVMVSFEGQDKEYSAFVATKPNVGDVWNGELKTAEKDGKTYHNFEFVKKTGAAPAGDINRVELKVDLVLSQLKTIGGILTAMKSKEEDPFADDFPSP